MSKLAALTTVLVLAAVGHVAHAETAGYVAGGGQVGNDLRLTSAVNLEAGIPVHPSAPLLHVELARGSFADLSEAVGSSSDTSYYYGQGSFNQYRLGVEGQRCRPGHGACFLYGADLGYLDTSDSSGPRTDTASARYVQYQVIPRAGFDFGGENLRVRLTLDIEAGSTTRTVASAMKTDVQNDVQGMRLGGAVAYRF